MDVAPWIANWILLVSDGITWYYMAFKCIQWYLMVLNGILCNFCIQWCSLVSLLFNGI